MFKNFVNAVCDMVNSLISKQEVKYYVKKEGHWDVATEGDLHFFKEEKIQMPRKRGELHTTNTQRNHILAVFVANENCKDIRYTIKQLQKAEKWAPDWLRKSSMEPDTAY